MSVLDPALARLYGNLASVGLPVFVGGSVAAMFYGEPRSTLDIDVVLQAGPEHAQLLLDAFPGEEFYAPPLDVLRAELSRGSRGQFNVIDLMSGLKADIYVAGDDPLIAFGFEAAEEQDLGGVTINIAPATYVVAMKLRFYGVSNQDKHLRDIRSVLAVSPERVDQKQVAEWAQREGLEEAWRVCLERKGEE